MLFNFFDYAIFVIIINHLNHSVCVKCRILWIHKMIHLCVLKNIHIQAFISQLKIFSQIQIEELLLFLTMKRSISKQLRNHFSKMIFFLGENIQQFTIASMQYNFFLSKTPYILLKIVPKVSVLFQNSFCPFLFHSKTAYIQQ